MNALGAVLAAYRAASGCDAALWEWHAAEGLPTLLASSSASAVVALTPPDGSASEVVGWAAARGWLAIDLRAPGSTAWLLTAPSGGDNHAPAAGSAAGIDAAMADVLSHVRRLIRERDGATHELAERYEEISLLYAIGELLGSGASVESVASTVLRELGQTIGAPRGALLLHEPTRDELYPVALMGIAPSVSTTVSVHNPQLLAARAFRSGQAHTEAGGTASRASAPLLAGDGGPVLAVPIPRASAAGSASLGTLLLAGRAGDAPFTAGDRKLVTAIASQVGTALHNARLVRAALEQEQLAREMRLAHDMQLKLLPSPRVVEPEAHAAARVVPAESVGGDFYLLARLDADRTGVVIGDVSGHGYQAALVMALAMSATAIHVQAVVDPAVALDAVHRSLADELQSTEMSITLFYGVIDAAAGVLRYANAGHPHAFVLRASGAVERLPAHAPPLGFGTGAGVGSVLAWSPGDRLLLFTDGVPDARNASGERLGEAPVLAAATSVPEWPHHGAHGGGAVASPAFHDSVSEASLSARTLEAIYDAVGRFTGETPLLDDLAVVVVDRVPVGLAHPHTPQGYVAAHAGRSAMRA
jgi:sigma-B regulation protein RsbU (phosphoserine phosphatase)